MDKTLYAIGMSLLLTIVTVGGDTILKHGAGKSELSGLKWLLLGMVIYALTAIGWYWIMKFTPLHVLGVIYAVSSIILLTGIGVFYFKEKINPMDYMAIFLAISALLIILRPK